MIFEKAYDGEHARRRNVYGELVFPHGKLLYILGHAGEEVLAVGM